MKPGMFKYYLLRLYTVCLGFKFKLLGKSVDIGRGVRIRPSVRIIPRNGTIKIGDNVSILPGAVLDTYNGSIDIGKNVSVNYCVMLYGHGGLTIGDDTRIAAHSVLIPANKNYSDRSRPIRTQGETRKGIFVGRDVWIAAGVIVLDGSNIADGCIIGANSTVSGTTESYGVYAGSPVRKIKER